MQRAKENTKRISSESVYAKSNLTEFIKIGALWICSNKKTCGDGGVATKVELVEILDFKHFYEHFTFGETDWSKRVLAPRKVRPCGYSNRTRNSRHKTRLTDSFNSKYFLFKKKYIRS